MKKKPIGKIISVALASTIVLGMSTAAFAVTETLPGYTKTYKVENDDTINPEETFTFKYTADHVTDTNVDPSTITMPALGDSTVSFAKGEATTAGLEKSVAVFLANVEWPSVGVYYYKVNEVAGNTAGVTYDDSQAYLKVTVAYDENSRTYYTAFVTLNLADEDGDGITDEKTAGFVNVYSAGDLQITKNVTGNLGDKNAYFAVDVTLTGEEGKTYMESYSTNAEDLSYGSEEEIGNPETIAIGETTTFYIKNGETIDIANLPYGVTYTVSEHDYTTADKGAYDAAVYSYSDNDKKIDSVTDTVTITNNKGTVVDTGITMNSMPYILVLAAAGIGMVVFFARKRMNNR